MPLTDSTVIAGAPSPQLATCPKTLDAQPSAPPLQAGFARCCVIGPGADLQEGHQVNAHLGDGEHAKSGRHAGRPDGAIVALRGHRARTLQHANKSSLTWSFSVVHRPCEAPL